MSAECSSTGLDTKGVIPTDTNKRYYINSIYKYTCKDGYNKTELDDVICREDGSWSVTPICTSYSKFNTQYTQSGSNIMSHH